MKTDKQFRILNHYLNGGTLTVVEARQRFSTTELRRVNSRLKKLGYNIYGVYENDNNGAQYKRYSLVSEIQQRLAI